MESLPQDEPESLAINWTGREVEEFLGAGGLSAVVTTHPKLTVVYHAQVKRVEGGVDEAGMLDKLRSMVKSKLSNAINSRRSLEAALLSKPAVLREWIVSTGTIARYSEELDAIDSLR